MPARAFAIGPTVLSHGFRTFFLAATLFGLAVVPLWFEVWQGEIDLGGPFQPLDWHVHEMIFGYAGAVIAGFLFTAVPNWTGRMPIRGWPLLVLAALWLAGRLAVAGMPPLPRLAVMTVDAAFLGAIVLMILVEIVAGKNWRNLKVLVPVLLLLGANLTFHAEVMSAGTGDVGRRLGIAGVLFLIMLIGGRIVPSFTRNWLVRRGSPSLPAPFSGFDAVSLASAALALGTWTVAPDLAAAGTFLALAGLLHLLRLARWRGGACWRSPLLAMLHVAYLFLPLGLLATAAGTFGLVPTAAGVHLLGIGAIGGMTVAVMIRASKGHTGQQLEAGAALTVAFVFIVVSAPVRAFMSGHPVFGIDGIALAALLWTLGFAIIALRLAPWLTSVNPARKRPSQAPA